MFFDYTLRGDEVVLINYVYSDLVEKGVTLQLVDGTIVIGTMETSARNSFVTRWQYIPQY
ncbi:hypothetical protein C0569_25985 [Priestia megaterium]|nr:hypothetical protein C0569_25985 [Priestia megaterium]